jgi:hypothetical protein
MHLYRVSGLTQQIKEKWRRNTHKHLIMLVFFSFRTPVFPHFFGLKNGSEQLGNSSMKPKESGKVYDTFSPFVGLDPAFARSNEARRRALYYAVLIALTG